LEEPWHGSRPDQKNERHEQRHLADGESQRCGYTAARELGGDATRIPTEGGRERRKQHESKHHHEVLDDQPPDGDTAVDRIERVALLQRAQQHDSARNRQRQPQHQAGADSPAPQKRERHAACRRDGDLRNGAGDRDGAHRQQVLDREMQAHAEHQENDTDFGELAREIGVPDKPRRERTKRYASEEIAHKRRQAQPMGHEAADKRQHQPHGDRGDERDVVGHLSPCGWRSSPFSADANIIQAHAPRPKQLRIAPIRSMPLR
jgi:hypothetical protein